MIIRNKKILFYLLILILSFLQIGFAATAGKISGRIISLDTGEPLPGVNIMIGELGIGTASDFDGNYTIMNVPPGLHTLVATAIGYAKYTLNEVKVEIDLTTSANLDMKREDIEGETVTVIAKRKIIRRDVSASVTNATIENISDVPVTTVSDFVGLQAGVEDGMTIRGSDANQTLFLVDGVSFRNERTNEPITGVSLAAVKEISLQTGGFNAEYGEVRSGLINVVTRSGSPTKYSGSVFFKMSPPGQKHFGISPYSQNSFLLKPYFDPDVCWTGTENGAWDANMQEQNLKFEGWNKVSEESYLNDPENGLSPAAAQREFAWRRRRQGKIIEPDYNIDAGFGGPVPIIGEKLGNLRFFTSFVKNRNMYIVPLSKDGRDEMNGMLKLVSDINPKMKLTMSGAFGKLETVSSSVYGDKFAPVTGYFNSPVSVAGQLSGVGINTYDRIFSDSYYSPSTIKFNSQSLKLTNMVNTGTYYEIQLKRMSENYTTASKADMDTSKIYELFTNYMVDEGPFGYAERNGGWSSTRDFSKINTYSAKFDLTSQVNHSNQLKTGIELSYTNLDLEYGSVSETFPGNRPWTEWEKSPMRGAVYIQDKLEYEGFVCNLGLRMDYSEPNTEWVNVDIYDKNFYTNNYKTDMEYKTEKIKPQLTFSPRLGVSHPISETSKMYFNYGHFRQLPTYENLYESRRMVGNQLRSIGDPTLPPAKTVAYELGYEQALFNQYLIHLSAYYKDVTEQQNYVTYISADSKVNYDRAINNGYEDIRGFECTIRKKAGAWFTGFANYTYMVNTSGYFGSRRYFENPSEQLNYERNTENFYQEKPLPIPFARVSLNFHTPFDFGPKLAGIGLLDNWQCNLLYDWRSGYWDTWNPAYKTGIEYNVQWAGYHNLDVRVSKMFNVGNYSISVLMDISNLLNHKQFSRSGFWDGQDYLDYMFSLHLPKKKGDELGYGNIPGEDHPGVYKNSGVDYVPMESVANIDNFYNPDPDVIYYEEKSEDYYKYEEDNWVKQSTSSINKLIDDRAYINMPNQTYFTFLNPRDFFLGIKITYNF